jgi:hypothetical protein
MLNVPKAEITLWESGKSVPSGNLIAKMDKIFGEKLPRAAKN